MSEHRKQTILTIMKIIRYCNVTPATKKELVAYTGRPIHDIGLIVNDMTEMGVLLKAGRIKSSGSRPAQLYEYNRNYKW